MQSPSPPPSPKASGAGAGRDAAEGLLILYIKATLESGHAGNNWKLLIPVRVG